MAIKSSLVTARGVSAVKKYELTRNAHVGQSFTLDSKAKTYYSALLKNYDNLKTYFTKISDEYTACATKSVNGDKLQLTLKKIAKNCKNQGSYCGDRKNDLVKYFRYAEMEKKINDLIKRLEELTKK